MAKEAERHVQSVSAALTVLAAFDGDVRLRLKDLHERTGLSRSRLLRFAGTLEACGFIEHDPVASTYALGPKLYALGWLLHERYSRMSEIVRPVLKRLVEASGDTAFYSTVQGRERLVVASQESTEGLRFIVKEGQVRPLVLGASGKVLIAFGSQAVRRRIFDSDAWTTSLAERDTLQREIDEIAARGFAVSRGEVTAHGFAVAVPVYLPNNAGCEALTIAGPLAKLTDSLAETYVERLLAEALTLSSALARIPGGASTTASAAE